MIKKCIAVFTVLLLTTSVLSAATTSGVSEQCATAAEICGASDQCAAAATAAEIYSCCYAGCDFGLWQAVYNACTNAQQ